MKEVQVSSGEKNIFGKEKMKIEKEWTKRIIVSLEDYEKMQDSIKNGIKAETRLNTLLNTDVLKENKALNKEIKDLRSEADRLIADYNSLDRDYNKLNEQNSLLRDEKVDLKAEIKLIYKSTKDFLKERTDDSKVLKNILKELTDDISVKLKDKNLDSNFKKEFDKENKKKRTRGMSR